MTIEVGVCLREARVS